MDIKQLTESIGTKTELEVYNQEPTEIEIYINKLTNLTNASKVEGVTTVQNLNEYSYSISEININNSVKKIIKLRIVQYLKLYLSTNTKCKNILNSELSINMIVDYFIEKCKNLELIEINLILKEGVTGQFGVLYGDINVDTIIGVDGWVETYYEKYRHLRKEPAIERNKILILAEKNMTTMDHIKSFYKSKNLTLDDLKDHCEMYSKEWVGLPFRIEPYQNKISELYSLQEIQGESEDVTREIENNKQILNSLQRSIAKGEKEYIMTRHNSFVLDNYYKKPK